MGVRGSGAFSAAIPVTPSEKHSWLAPAPSRAVGSRGPLCPILVLIPNYQVVQSTFIEGISGDEVKSTSNQSAEVGPYHLGRIRALQTLAKKKPSLLGSCYLLGAHQGPSTHATPDTQVA